MSSTSQADTEAAQIIDLYENVFPTNCMLWAVTSTYLSNAMPYEYALINFAAMLAYDYLITLNEEIKLFWRRKTTGASVLFFIIRYAALLNYTILNPALSANISDVRCDYPYIPWAAFSALRVLALTGMRWPLALLVFVLALGPSAVNFAAFKISALTGANVLTVGCQGEDSATALQGEMYAAMCVLALVHTIPSCAQLVCPVAGVSRTSLAIADVLVIVVTVATTWRRGFGQLERSGKASLKEVLLYNDSEKWSAPIQDDSSNQAYSVLFVLNLASVVLTHLSIGEISQRASYITLFSEPLTAMFISRFLLDLQSANRESTEVDTHAHNPLSNVEGSLRFAATIETFGATERSDGVATADLEVEADLPWTATEDGRPATPGELENVLWN
ncbi:hypothetical protein C8Q78DRAFT_1074627 [Trametes maxima]|nr:hypothetical protein C8Q78DRAFT_1074627 [Trametes maxima]